MNFRIGEEHNLVVGWLHGEWLEVIKHRGYWLRNGLISILRCVGVVTCTCCTVRYTVVDLYL